MLAGLETSGMICNGCLLVCNSQGRDILIPKVRDVIKICHEPIPVRSRGLSIGPSQSSLVEEYIDQHANSPHKHLRALGTPDVSPC